MLVRVRRKALDAALIVNPNSCSGLTGKNRDELDAKKEKVLVKSKDRKVKVTIDGEPIGILSAEFRVPKST